MEQPHVLSKRLNKILEARFENEQETLEALKQLSSFFKENTLQARRNLRSQIEKRSLDINRDFLASFLEVKETFDSVYNDVEEMSKSIKEMTQRLQNSKTQTKQLLQQTNVLHSGKLKNTTEQKISAAFFENFQLPDNLLPVRDNKEPLLSCDMFNVLDKVQLIHNNCKILMQAGYQSLASDIMEQMTIYQEGALEKLYRWAQNHCRSIDNQNIGDLVTKAMARLQSRPVLFQYVIDEYCIYRRSILVGEFINALTRGGPSGNPAPIETRAHDIQIYVTDMLVWLNKAVPVENQNLHLLVKLCDSTTIEDLIINSMDSITEGLCQPLKIRIEKILNVPAQTSTIYSVVNLLRYYKKCICKIVKKGLLQQTLTELVGHSEQVFFATLQIQVNTMLIRVEAPQKDLSPTPAINSLLLILRDMLSTASLCEGREVDMGKVADCIMEPLMRSINEQASHLPPIDMAVYMLNCIYDIYTCLSLYEFMEERLERFQAQADAQIDTLTSEQVSSMVANLNLGPIYTILQDQCQEPLSKIPGMEPADLKNFLVKLDYLTATPDSILLQQINLLASSKHKKAIQKRSFEVLMAIYKQLYEAVNNPRNGYENPQLIFTKTPEELEDLLLRNNT